MKKFMLCVGALAVCSLNVSADPVMPSLAATAQPGAVTPPAAVTAAVKPATVQPVDCNYKIPAETMKVEDALVMQWATKATQQSFNFEFDKIDNQMTSLKNCYTDQGWQGFNDALQKSGNLDAIRSQKLMVSSVLDGKATILDIKNNEWKINMPLHVTYQSSSDKSSMPLSISLVVGRKISGDLGIMQMIATPRQASKPLSTEPLTAPAVKQP